MKQELPIQNTPSGWLRRFADWMGHLTLIDTRWGRRVLRQVYREREFKG